MQYLRGIEQLLIHSSVTAHEADVRFEVGRVETTR